jgi:hypothetical protein
MVLVVSGNGTNGFATATAELYDPGLGFSASAQPQIASVSSSGGRVTITGSSFRGIAEGSSGNSQDSSTDYPVVQLMRLQSGQTFFLSATNWSANSIAAPLITLPAGHLLATVFVNGIPSAGTIFQVSPMSFVANSTNQLSSSMLLPSFGPGGVRLTCTGVQGVSYRVQRAPTPAVVNGALLDSFPCASRCCPTSIAS